MIKQIQLNLRADLIMLSVVYGLVASTSIQAAENSTQTAFKVIISKDKGSELQLDARQAPLAQVLEHLAMKTNIPIHYSALPEELVTATCVGTSLKSVLECLFANKADVAFRAQGKSSNSTNDVAEAWIMGSSLGGKVEKDSACLVRAARAEKELQALKQKLDAQDSGPDMTDDFLKMSESKRPQARAAAIGALLSSKRKDDPAVKATLERALTDQDAAVRAQAISAMAQLAGDNVNAVLQDALQDESVDVRLMAVSSITDNMALLQQAANDSDETVRTLATIKLKELETNKR